MFDPLEPRLLLSADVLSVNLAHQDLAHQNHALVVEMVTEPEQVGDTTQDIQRVQIVDQAQNNAVLAFGDLSVISQINIIGDAQSTSATNLVVDWDSFGDLTAPSISFTGGGGANTLSIKHESGDQQWQIDAPGAGQASGLANVTFSNVQQLIGGDGNDILTGPTADTTFNVTGAGAGNLINPGSGSTLVLGFAGFEHLQGAANNNDAFVFAQNATIAGGVDGGDAGFDTLVLDGSYLSVLSAPVDAHSGSITLDGNTIQYAGLEPIQMGSAADVVFDLPDGSDATLSADTMTGFLQLVNPFQSETTVFANPTNSLTINLYGTSGLTVQPLDPGFAASFIVDSPNNDNTSGIGEADPTTVVIDSSTTINTNGGTFSLNAVDVTLKSGVVIDTTSATAASGTIKIAGATNSAQGPHNITIESGVTLNAAAVGGTAGDITIATIDSSWRPVELPIYFTAKSVGVDLQGTSAAPVMITGGNVTITATATDTTLPSDAPIWAAGFTSNLQGWFQQVPGNILSAATGLDASVMYRGADANITVDNTTITSASSVKIASTTSVSSIVNAIATSNGTTAIPNFQAAVGVAVTTSTVKTIVSGASTINAAKDVTISAGGSTTAKATARTSNLLTGTPDPNASSVAIALSLDSLTDYAEVGKDAVITATTGNVSVTATGKTSNGSSASTAGFVDAVTGISAAIPIDLADVHAYLNGTVTAGGTITGAAGPTFDPQTDLDLVTSEITLPNVGGLPGGLTNGQQIIYMANGTEPIGGLVDGGTYTVVVIDSTHIRLANGPTLALDPTGTNPASTQTLTGVTGIAFDLNSIDSSQNTIHITQNGFEEGDIVTYNANPGNVITGLTDGERYVVHVVNSDEFQLLDKTNPDPNNPVPISQGQALGQQSFTRDVDGFGQIMFLGRIENGAIIAQPGTLTNNQTVIYQSLDADGANSLGGLVNVNEYAALVSGDTIQLKDPETGQIIQITDPGVASAQSLGWGQAYGFNPTSTASGGDVDPTTGTIYLPGNNLNDGDVVTYQVDPNITTTVTVPTQTEQNQQGPSMTVTAADQEIGGLVQGNTYYVVKIDQDHISLTEDDTTAALAIPITFTSTGNATNSQLATEVSGKGITVSSSLTVKDTAKAKPETGGKFNWSKYSNFLTQSDVTLFALFTDKTTSSVVTGKTAADPANNKPAESIQNNSFSSAGAVDFIYADHTSKAIVGNLGATSLISGSNVNVSSTLTQTYQEIAQASVSKPGGSQGVGLALAIAVGIYDNENEAIIDGNASVDAQANVSVSAQLTYPPLNDTVPFSSAFWNLWLEQLQSSGISAVTNLLDGTLGIASNYLNTWAIAGVKALDPKKPAPSTAITGSIVVNVFTNKSNALIKSGANINQRPQSGWLRDNQSVSLSANTTVQMLDVAGNGKWSLNPLGILGKLTPSGNRFFPGESKSLSDQWNAGDIVALGGSAGTTAVGGSILVPVMTNTTKALIEAGANVFVGQNGTLNLDATEDIFRVEVAQAGGTAKGQNATVWAGSALAYVQTSTTLAGIVASDSSAANITGGGKVSINAATGGTQVSVAGTIIYRSGGSTGLGLAANVDNFFRETSAFIGADPTVDPDVTPTSASTLEMGDTTIAAGVTGTIVGVAVAGTFSSSVAAPSQNVVNPVQGVNGPNGALPNVQSATGIAGSGAAFILEDTTLAYVNATGTGSVGKLDLTANNNQTIFLLSGGVAIGLTAKDSNTTSSQWSGAFSMNLITSDTEAFIKGVTFTSAGAITATATHSGAVYSFSAALAVDTSQTGKAFAGSVSINRLIDTTKAVIQSASITNGTSVTLSATDDQELLAIGGGASFTAGRLGIGATFGYNQLAGNTEAKVIGTDARRSSLALSDALGISATNAQKIQAYSVSAGITLAAQATAGAFTIGINILSSSSNVFNRENAVGLVAEILKADVQAGGAVTVTATDKSGIVAIGGAVGVGVKGNAFGAGLGWNQMALNIDAEVNNATITSGGAVSVSSSSTQENNLLDSKIVTASVGAAVSAGGQGPGAAVGVNVSVNGTFNTIRAQINTNSQVTANGGNIAVGATDNSKISALSGAVAISTTGTGAGAALSGNYISNIVKATIDASTAHATAGNVSVTADEEANIQALAVGLEGAEKYAAGGSISAGVITDTVEASIAGAATVTASGTVGVQSINDATIGTIAGQIAIGGKVGVGISVVTSVVVDKNNAFISGDANVTGNTGVSINANTTETLSVFAVGGTLGGSVAGVAVTTTVTVVDDTTLAYIGAPSSPSSAGLIQGGTGSGATGDVTVNAKSDFDLLGTAGALTWGGKASVGVGVDAGVVTRVTKAYIGAGAQVSADGSVSVTANATETIWSFSIAGAFSQTAAVGLTAGVSTLNLTTNAYVDEGAVVFAKNNALVSADDQTEVTLVSGNLTASGTAAVGVAAGITVLNKDTNAYIAANAQVTALAQGAAVTANTGSFGTASGSNTPQPAVNLEFKTSQVDFVNDTITVTNGSGLNDGDLVVYSAANLPLGGLNNAGEYYVINKVGNSFQLSLTKGGTAIDLTASTGDPDPDAAHTVERLNNVGVPSVTPDTANAPQLNLSDLANNLLGPPQQAARQGVIVVAVSTNSMQSAGVAGGGSGSVAVQVAGGIAVHTINTSAKIDSGAQINQAAGTAGGNQSVYVDAGRSYYNLTLGIGAAFSGSVAISPTLAVPVLNGTTSARIAGPLTGSPTLVAANLDVEVSAVAQAQFIVIGAGITASGYVGIAGSAAVLVVDTLTEAVIGGLAQVAAGRNVVVNAMDTTVAYSIAGNVGIGFGGGGGAGSLALSLITKNTNAYIRDGAIVDALGNGTTPPQGQVRGVTVQAFSSEQLTNVAGSGAGGLYVGIAGGVDSEIINTNTVAAIFGGALINQGGAAANADQSVAVAARNDLNIIAVAGALGVGAAGIGAGVDIEVIRTNVIAFIYDDGTKVGAAQQVTVDAISNRDILSIAVGVGAGVFALGGGVSVISIGGDFSDQYTGSNEGGSLYSANALNGGSGDVIPSADSTINEALSLLTTPNSGGLPVIDPATAVDNTTHTVDFGVADNLQTGDAVEYSSGGGAPIDGLTSGQTYFVITQGPNTIQLAASYDDALAGRFIEITNTHTTGTNHQFSAGSADIANAARVTAGSSLPYSPLSNGTAPPTPPPVPRQIASGTSALVGPGATIAANSVAVRAAQEMTVESYPGGGSLGVVGIGVGLAVVNIAADVSAYVSPQVTLTGLNGAGDLTISANRTATVSVLGVAGSVSGFVALGASVAFVNDTSNVQAALGVSITDNGLVQATQTSDAAEVDGQGFAAINVAAEHTDTMKLSTAGFAIAQVAGLGAAITSGDIESTTQAIVGDYTIINTLGGLAVTAERTATIGPYAGGGAMGVGLAGGFLGGTASWVQATTGGTVAAYIGNAADVEAQGDIAVSATATTTHNVGLNGVSLGAIAVGVMLGNSTVTGAVTAAVGRSPSTSTGPSSIKGRKIAISATGSPNVTVDSTPAAGGIIAGSGAVSTVNVTPTVSAVVADQTTLASTGDDITITSTSTPTATARAEGENFGGVTVGISTANLTVENSNTVSIGADADITAFKNFSALATTTNTPTAQSKGSASALVPLSSASSTLNLNGPNNNTVATIGAGAQIRAFGGSIATPIGTLSVEANTSTTARSTGSVNTGGLGTSGDTTTKLTISGSTNTDIGSAAQLEAATVNILARVITIDAQSKADTTANAAGAGTTSVSNLTTTLNVTTTIGAGAQITGSTAVNIKARQESLQTTAKPTATSNALGTADATARNTLTTTTNVNATDATTTISTRTLNVEAFADTNPTFTTDAHRSAVGGGSASNHPALGLTREINWNAGIIMLGAPDPILQADDQGVITGNIAYTKPDSTTVNVLDIFNDGTLAGTVNFSIPASYWDTHTSSTVTASATITGAPTITFITGFNQVSIVSAYAYKLVINAINVLNNASSFAGNITVNVGDKSGFTWTTVTDPGKTKINIQNIAAAANGAGTTDIVFQGLINNPYGSTVAKTQTGNVFSTSSALIKTNALVLGAEAGAIGTVDAPINIQATEDTTTRLLAALAKNDIYINGIDDGDEAIDNDVYVGYVGATLNGVTVNGISSESGKVNLQTTTSILDAVGNTGDAANILANTITLGATGGSIGTPTDALNIGSTGASTSLTASANTSQTVTDVAVDNALNVVNVVSQNGDITLATTASPQNPANDILLAANAVITASKGAVTLRAADNLQTAAGSQILAFTKAILSGDYNNTVNRSQKTIDLKGLIKGLDAGSTAEITSGPNSDTINI